MSCVNKSSRLQDLHGQRCNRQDRLIREALTRFTVTERPPPPRTVVIYNDDLVLHFGHLHAAVGVADPLVRLHVKHL